jgi:putative exporter of polyketide antibiotics
VLTCAWLPVLRLPFAGSAVLGLSVGGTGLAFAGVAAGPGRRGVGAPDRGRVRAGRPPRPRRGLLPGRPGRPAASGLLRGPLVLAWRLQGGVLLAWLTGYVLTFAAFGPATKGIDSVLGTSATLKRYFLRIGYQTAITSDYLSATMVLAGLGAAVFATSAVLRLRAEETGNLAEPVLATATGRIRWGLSHIWVAAGGASLLLAAAGLSAGLGYGVLTGSAGTQVPRLLGAGIVRLPAVLVLTGLTVLLFGLLPWEAAGLAWSAVATSARPAWRPGSAGTSRKTAGDPYSVRLAGWFVA